MFKFSFVFSRNFSYAQIQTKWSMKTDIKAIKIQSKHFSQFQCWHSHCVLHLYGNIPNISSSDESLQYRLLHLIWIFIQDKKKGCMLFTEHKYWIKPLTTDKYCRYSTVDSLQIAPPNINIQWNLTWNVFSYWSLNSHASVNHIYERAQRCPIQDILKSMCSLRPVLRFKGSDRFVKSKSLPDGVSTCLHVCVCVCKV